MATIPDLESTGTLSFHQALSQAEAAARSVLPAEVHERLSSAVALVQSGAVIQSDDLHTWHVTSQTDPQRTYAVNGSCPCDDAHFHPGEYCKRQLAVHLSRKVLRLMQTPAPAPEPIPAPTPATGKRAIPAHFLQQIQGQTFIKYAGLVQLAHERGLQELRATWTYNDGELSLAHAVATFLFGTFADCGDSTPQNAQRVGFHWRRLSLTRAKARCLRDALGIDMCSVEEMD